MAIDLSTSSAICHMCGMKYSRRKGYFPVSYAIQHKGLGHAPICRECVDRLYDGYLSQCNDPKLAVRQVCRKLDLYWEDKIYELVVRKSTTKSMMTQYMAKLTSNTYAGKSYDDTLSREGRLWDFANIEVEPIIRVSEPEIEDDGEPVSEEVMTFWGSGYTPNMYRELEARRNYWMSKFPSGMELDIGTEAIIRQICSLELDINRDRAAGRAVDKNINTLNTLLGSANLKPVQKRQEEQDQALSSTPLGVWLYRYENKRPLPDEYDDSRILKYVFSWMGHLCKMLGIKGNKYSKLYEDVIRKYTVDKPEYDGEDEEEAFEDYLESTPDYGSD